MRNSEGGAKGPEWQRERGDEKDTLLASRDSTRLLAPSDPRPRKLKTSYAQHQFHRWNFNERSRLLVESDRNRPLL